MTKPASRPANRESRPQVTTSRLPRRPNSHWPRPTPEERGDPQRGTEPPFCGGLLSRTRRTGVRLPAVRAAAVRSVAKFESGTGWPSFTEPFDKDHVASRDASHGWSHEIRCAVWRSPGTRIR